MPLILIVDDDEDSRQMLKFLLEMWQFSVIEAKDGMEALSIAEAERVCLDLILMDVKLPHLDGFEATRRIRQCVESDKVPIIFLSGCGEVKYRNAASAAGGNEYLVKPLDFEELQYVLCKYIPQFGKHYVENIVVPKLENKSSAEKRSFLLHNNLELKQNKVGEIPI